MLFCDVCKPQGVLPACNHLATELLELLKTANISNVHRNRMLHAYYTAAMCTGRAKALLPGCVKLIYCFCGKYAASESGNC